MQAVGMTADYIVRMRSTGLPGLTPETLVHLKAVGVTPEYVRELAGSGAGPFTPEQLFERRTEAPAPGSARTAPEAR
jgi:hypothetical protein